MNGWRKNLIIILFFLVSAAIVGRLFYLQVMSYQYWRAMAQGQQNITEDDVGERGQIFSAGKTLSLAINRDVKYAFISPSEVKDRENAVGFLSEALGLQKEYIEKKLKNKESFYELLKDDISEEEAQKINNENIAGVYVGQKRERYYPQGTLASDVLGFVDKNGNGQYGVEGYYNDDLSGQYGIFRAEEGADLILGIDYNVQFMAEKLLKNAIESLQAEGGQIIVVKPDSGKIVALADYPSFDPNSYSGYAKEGNLEVFQNSTAQKLYEPGSVLKPITMAMGIEEEKITPQTTYQDPGVIKMNGRSIYNYAQRIYEGDITMTQVLEKSINTGAVFVEQKIAHDVFWDYLDKFGFFEKTGVDTQETYSENYELKNGKDISFATASFGQGIEITPLQLVRAFSAIANGGKLPRLYLVDEKIEDGESIKIETEFSDQIISQQTASQVTSMMVSVTENGYGKAAKVAGYYVAGKTGTAQVAEEGAYSADKTIQSFIGFAPAYNPQFLILVKLDSPQAKTAEYSAVPVFKDLASYIINLWQIPPDYKI